MKNIYHIANILYSYVWIAVHHTDKFRYRDESKVHEWLVSKY